MLEGRAGDHSQEMGELSIRDHWYNNRFAMIDRVAAIGEQSIDGSPEGIAVGRQIDDVGWQLIDRVDGWLAIGGAHATNFD